MSHKGSSNVHVNESQKVKVERSVVHEVRYPGLAPSLRGDSDWPFTRQSAWVLVP